MAADQPTVIIDESLATHTEILSVNHQVIEKGEEVDQTAKAVAAENIVEEAAENIDEETAENNLEATAEIAVESTAVDAENEENAQDNINSEKLANADVPETFAENIPHSSNAESSAKSDDQADSSSQRLSAQPNQKDIQHATELHF